jgi:RHS repeat-associated protein
MLQGRRLDEETGLYDFRARVHDTARGRFMQRDVLEPEDNLYEFAKDNPINVTDQQGCSRWS